MVPLRPAAPEERLLSGWGRTRPVRAVVVAPADPTAVAALLRDAGSGGRPPRPLVARGLGRSYGDAAQCAGGTVVDVTGLSTVGPVGPDGAVTVGAGTRLGDLTARVLPLGWFLPVTPGTEDVTVGGAIAADVHGKNHHREGSFCRHVRSLTLATPTGVVRVGPDDDPALFWATAGGMGLTGVVLEATVELVPVASSWMVVDTLRFDGLDDLMAEMVATDAAHRYSVAWVDCMVGGGRLGRGVLTRGDHAPADAVPARHRGDPLGVPRRPRLQVPLPPPRGLVHRHSVGLFNEAWFRRAPRRTMAALHRLHGFFYPLDGLRGWNLLYGPLGFVQYQFVVGDDRTETVRHVMGRIAGAGLPAMLAVLKRFGPGDPGPLSFPSKGWTLALDFPVGSPDLPRLLDALDELVAGAGGRVYLAKDARLRPELLPAMYPRLGELQAVRRRVDPGGVLGSDLSRRLGLGIPDAGAPGPGAEGTGPGSAATRGATEGTGPGSAGTTGATEEER